nr:serine-rich adhesin for platelets-like [Crassostrea gigas]
MMNHIDVLTCYINEPCSIPFSVFKYNNSKPHVELGHFDKTFELKSLVLEPSANQGGIVHGTLTVIGYDLGMKLICVDSFDSLQKTKIEDELCYKINVTKGQYFAPKKLFPYFLHPTPPDSTTMQCVVNEQCYINIWAKNKLGVDHCPLLLTDKNIEDGVYVFPLNDTVSQPCRFDVSILPDNTTDLHLCFTLSSDASEVDNHPMYEDKRCFFISFIQELKGQSPCAGVSCQHNGFCDGSSPVSRCLCRSGFSSENCSKEFGLAQGIGNYSVSQLTPLFGDFVLPKFIRCPLREECVIPYSVTKTDSSCGFHLSWSGENFSSVHFTNSMILESLDCSGRATIIHNVSGIDEFCLSLKSSDGLISYDNVCCNVSSEPDTADVNLYMFQSKFFPPSPTNGSEFSCTPGQPCHVMFSTGKLLNQKCPDVRDITTSPVYIFASLNTECHHDILILSEKNDTGSKKYCFQTMVSGITGETRCITVHFMFHVLPIITTTTVTDISSTSTSSVSQSSLNVFSTTDVPITANSVNAQDSNTEGGSSTISLSTTSLSTNANSNNGQNFNTESSSTTISSSSTDMSTAAKTIIAQNSNTNSALTTTSFSTLNKHVVSNSNNALDSNTEGGSSTISLSTTSLSTNANSNNGQNVNTESSSFTISSSSTEMSTAAKTIIAQNSSTNSALTTASFSTSNIHVVSNSNNAQDSNTEGGSSTISLSTTSLPTYANSNNGQNVNTESSSTTISSSSTDMSTAAKTIITQNPIAKSGSTTVPLSTTNMPVVSNSDNAQDSNTEVGPTIISLSTTSLPTNANPNNGQDVNTESSLSTISSSTIPLSTTNMPTVSMPDNAQDSNTEVGSTTILSSTSSIPSVSHSNIAQDSNTESVSTTIPFAPSAISPTVTQTLAKGRVECYCINPDNGIITKVIALNPRVSTEKLLIAAGLGSGAMVTTLGVAALLFTLTKGFRSSNKTGRTQNSRKSRKISVQSLKDEEN